MKPAGVQNYVSNSNSHSVEDQVALDDDCSIVSALKITTQHAEVAQGANQETKARAVASTSEHQRYKEHKSQDTETKTRKGE